MTRPRVLVATRSHHKLAEVRAILGGTLRLAGGPVDLVDLEMLGIPADAREDEIEAFDTFRDNALAKARHFAARSGLPTIADDSGIVVHALGGAPGVRSKRFAGRADLSGQALDDANNTLLLERLAAVPDAERTAHYVCAAACVLPQQGAIVALGTSAGRILRAPAGTGGFGYDPLFLVPEMGCSFGQLDSVAKHAVSHRGRAFRALAAFG